MKWTFILLMMFATVMMTLNANNLSVIENNNECLRLKFNNDINNIFDTNRQNTQGFSENINYNNYNLPVINCLIQVPSQHKAVVSLVNPKYSIQENVSIDLIDKEIPVDDNVVMLSKPFIMRSNRLSTLSVQPQIYNSQELQISNLVEAEIRIDFVADESSDVSAGIRQSKEFKSWLSQSVINYRDVTRNGESQGSLLIIYNQTAAPLSYIQPLIDWKHQKGWVVNAVSTAVAGSSTTTIKNYIQNAYNTWVNPPEYILLLGRSTQTNNVPTYSYFYHYNTVGDYQYTLLDGTDIIPDAYIGRLTFSSTDQLTSMINKILAYEKKQGLGSNNWYNSNLLVSDTQDSGISCTTNIDYIKELMLEYNANASLSYVVSNVSTAIPSQVYNAMNQGVSNFYYRGHNGYSGMTNTDIGNLVNTGKYPFISMITCFSGNFGQQSQLSIGEQFMRIGTASSPKGGIGFIGSSCETHTCLNNIMTGSIAYGFYKEGLTNQGQALLRAKLGLLANYPQYPHDYIEENFLSLNLIGDPTIDIWQKQPVDINVQYSHVVNMNNGFLNVTVHDLDGNPVSEAKVCLLKGNDEIFQTGYTNSQGCFVFEWSSATVGFGTLTVTKPNHSTYQGSVEFADQMNYFTINNISAFDQLCSGSVLSIPISLTNNHYSLLMNVTASLSSSSEYVTITNDSVSIGNMLIEQTLSSLQNVEFNISEQCPQNENLAFALTLQGTFDDEIISYTIHFQTVESGPSIEVAGYQLGIDNVLLPGEISNFTIKLKNSGVTAATGVSATVYSYNPDITLSQTTQTFTTINSGFTVTNSIPYIIEANQSIYSGSSVVVMVNVSYNNGASQLIPLTIRIGTTNTSEMTGPDSYGYFCVSNSDNHPLAKPYNWIEVNPVMGGLGTTINITDSNLEGSGSWYTINMPFTFKYYGVNYSQITVCSNGFIMPGNQGSQEWMNWKIPGPMVPRPIIAPFWDDLIIMSDSKIAYYYDSVNNCMIIEWYKLRNKYNTGTQESFEVIIYDSVVYNTQTGDNALLFQYKTFNNVDAGNYGVTLVDHGQYSTVGIGDHTGEVGLCYTYQNTYPPTAATITNSSTLFFTTMPNQNYLPNPVIQSYQFSELQPIFANSQIDCGETISLTPVITNIGSTNLLASTVTLTTDDDYVTLITSSSTLNSIDVHMSSAVTTPFQIFIDSNCPNLREISFNLHIDENNSEYDAPFSITVNSPQIEFSSFLVNGTTQYYLEPEVVTPIVMQIVNHSNILLENASFTFHNNYGWTAFPNQIICSIPALGSISVNFDLCTNETASLGEEVEIVGTFNCADVYDSTFTKSLYVGEMTTISNQNFDIQTDLLNWTFTSGVSIEPSSHINNSGNEVVITPVIGTTNYSLISPLIFAYDSQIIQFSFKYQSFNANSMNSIFVDYNNSQTWIKVFDFNEQQSQTSEKSFIINNIPPDIQTIRFKMQFSIPTENMGIIVIDDISLKSIHHEVGFVCGTVQLDNFVQNITQVRISTSVNPGIYVSPDQSGNYSLPLYQGSYPEIKAEIENYLPQEISNIEVTSGQNLDNINFHLAYMRKPNNVEYTIVDKKLSLNWQLEPYTDNLSNRFEPDYYLLYITHNNETISDTTSFQSYLMDIEYGAYQLCIKSVFHDYNNIECYSDSSDIVQINFTASNDNQSIPLIFGLKQNYPNPFNPKTSISYTLDKPGNLSLNIYNSKGENVRNMINSQVQKAGIYKIEFDGMDNNSKPLASGVYFYRLSLGNKIITKKMILLK